MRISLKALGVIAALAVGVRARGQVTLTFTGTAGSTALGYTSGQSYSFSFTTASSFASTSRSTFSGSTNDWIAAPTDPLLITTVTGGGLSGTLSSGVVTTELQNSTSNLMLDFEDETNGGAIGYTANGNSLNQIYVLITPATVHPFSFSLSGSYTNPANYFANYTGTYSMAGVTNNHFLLLLGDSSSEMITLTSVTIANAAAIPEPSNMGWILGAVVCMGAAGWRRRKAGKS